MAELKCGGNPSTGTTKSPPGLGLAKLMDAEKIRTLNPRNKCRLILEMMNIIYPFKILILIYASLLNANLQGKDTYHFVITEYYSLHAPPPFHKLSSIPFYMKFGKSLSFKSNCVKYIIYNIS